MEEYKSSPFEEMLRWPNHLRGCAGALGAPATALKRRDLMDTARLENRLSVLNAPVRRRIARFFSGKKEPFEVYGLLSEFLFVEGKRLRPALCLLACEAVGGRKEAALPAAAAVEMFHNFTLIHDDIEDSSEKRRGRPCMHVKYGLPLALNAGDGLFMMVWEEARTIKGKRREDAQARLLAAFTKVLEGQAVELGWYRKGRWDVSEQEYYLMVGGKTGALIAASCEVGALLGGADRRTCRALYDFGMGIGIGFQIIDDVLNIVGDETKYRKEIGGDIREGKRTLLTVWALEMLPKTKRGRLERLLRACKKSRKDVLGVIALIKESGAVGRAVRRAEVIVGAAVDNLEALPDSRAKDDLRLVAGYITRRER
jgi:geranylgeranyl pyrophosphate synthase